MAGQNHGRDLIAELLVGKGLAGFRIARVTHQVEQVARRRAFVLAGSAALGHQHADECGPALAEAGAGEILRGRPTQRQQQIEKMRARQPLAILHHEIAQGGAMPVHPEREHRAAGDFERHPLHRLAQIDGRVAGGPELGDGLVGRRQHVRNERRHRARREGRRQRPALVFPRASFRDQQAFAEDRTQHAEAGRRARIVFVIVDQHMPDRIRRVEDETAAAKEAALDDVFLIGPLAPAADRADADRLYPTERRHVVGRARRARRHQPGTPDRQVVGFGYAHGRHSRSPDERSDIRDRARPRISLRSCGLVLNYVCRSGRHKGAIRAIRNS